MSDITLEWFFRIPGLFITIGVVLILIAIVVFIIGNATKSKEMNNEVKEDDNVDNSINQDVLQNNELHTNLANVNNELPVLENNINNLELDNNNNIANVDNSLSFNDNILGVTPQDTSLENNVLINETFNEVENPVVLPVEETINVMEPVTNLSNDVMNYETNTVSNDITSMDANNLEQGLVSNDLNTSFANVNQDDMVNNYQEFSNPVFEENVSPIPEVSESFNLGDNVEPFYSNDISDDNRDILNETVTITPITVAPPQVNTNVETVMPVFPAPEVNNNVSDVVKEEEVTEIL